MPPPIGVGQGDGVTLGAIVGSGVWLGIKLGVAELATINGSVAVAVDRGTVGVGVDVSLIVTDRPITLALFGRITERVGQYKPYARAGTPGS